MGWTRTRGYLWPSMDDHSSAPTEVKFWPVGTAAMVKEEHVELADEMKYTL